MNKLTPRTLSALIALAVALWMASGLLKNGDSVETTDAHSALEASPLPRVVVRESLAGPVVRDLRVTARTAPSREATLAAETTGRIVAIGAQRGDRVSKGEVIARIDVRWREEQVAEAKALVRQREIEYQGATRLADQGYRAESQKAEAFAALEAARSHLRTVELDLDATTVRAPFDGSLNDRFVEVGDFVDVGNPVAEVVQTDPFIVVADVAETEVSRLAMGGDGAAELIDGRILSGHIRYLAAKADPATRTFRVELEVDNPSGEVVTGMTAQLVLPIESVVAHRLPSSLLSLDEEGNPGIKFIADGQRVGFHRVDVSDIRGSELIVDGLADQVSVITTGQGFVRPGDQVDAVPEAAIASLDNREQP